MKDGARYPQRAAVREQRVRFLRILPSVKLILQKNSPRNTQTFTRKYSARRERTSNAQETTHP
jgi:hypothetical protein